MSRIGNRILAIPENVTVEVVENLVKVKGPKGELETSKCKNVNVEVKDGRWRAVDVECPTQECVHVGWVDVDHYWPIVCLPNGYERGDIRRFT